MRTRDFPVIDGVNVPARNAGGKRQDPLVVPVVSREDKKAHGVPFTRRPSNDFVMLERSVCNTVRETRKGALLDGQYFWLGARQRVASGSPQADSP
jgi:hypothetical protein